MRASLTLRLALVLSLVVGATLLITWTAVSRGAIAPFSREVVAAFMDEAVYAAEQVAGGADAATLGAKMGLTIRPHSLRRPPAREGWQLRSYRGHRVAMHRGRGRAVAAVETAAGWVVVQRELDLDAPRRRLRLTVLLVGLGVIGSAALLARRVTRPLERTREAMERVAAGDLDWRLPETGPRELVALARSYNAMSARVAELLRSEKALMAGISHELRTPITRLRLELELLWDLGEAALTEDRLEAMEGDLAELERLIAELLEISRLELGQQRLSPEPLSLLEIAREAARRCPLPQHVLRVTGEGEVLEGDRELLLRAVGNLLQNAGRYAPAGTAVEIAVRGRSLSVLDRGPGVPEEALERIFAPFYRQDPSRSRATGGVGLGLMIARQIAGLHGGRISAHRRPGGGLAVTLELPPAPPPRPDSGSPAPGSPDP